MWRRPHQNAWLRLGQNPSGCLFRLVVPSAERRQIALASHAALVIRSRVVEVATSGGSAAAGEAAGPVPDLDDRAQLARWVVAGNLPRVAANATLKPCESQLCEPNGMAAGRPRAISRASVTDRPSVRAGERHAPPSAGACRELAGQVATDIQVERAVPGDLAGYLTLAKPGRQRHGQVDRTCQSRIRPVQ